MLLAQKFAENFTRLFSNCWCFEIRRFVGLVVGGTYNLFVNR